MRHVSRRHRVFVTVVALLSLLGVAVAVARALFLDDLLTVTEPHRSRFLADLEITDPFAEQRRADMAWFDARFARHRAAALVHVLLGGFVLALVPLQVVGSIRRWSPRLHRWSGRLLVSATSAVVLTGLFFGVGMPYGGLPETGAALLVGALCVTAFTCGVLAIRDGQVERHRAWMLRGAAVLVGIATIRVVGGGLDLLLTPLGVSPRTIFNLSLWLGWGLSIGAVELWIVRAPDAAPVSTEKPATQSRVTAAAGRPV